MQPEFDKLVSFGYIRLLVMIKNIVLHKQLNVGLKYKQVWVWRYKVMIINCIVVGGNVFADFPPVDNVLYKLVCSFGCIGSDGSAAVSFNRTKCNMNIVNGFCNFWSRLAVTVSIRAEHLIGEFPGDLIHKIDDRPRLALVNFSMARHFSHWHGLP